MQHVIRPAVRDAHFQRLDAGAHAPQGAVMISAMFIDHAGEAALPFVDVVGDIRQEVGVAAILLAHHAILVIAEIRGA